MKTTVDFIKGLSFSECPRIHKGSLWFSDFFKRQVLKADFESGKLEVVCKLDDQPSGLGWLPNGQMLVVSMINRKVLRLEDNGDLVEYADLSDIASYHCNDMVVDREGRAYVGNFGGDIASLVRKYGRTTALNMDLPTAALTCIEPDSKIKIAAENMLFPNGSVITENGSTLIVAETYGRRLTAFDINEDGQLTNRRIWAAFDHIYPDGICIDSKGDVWVANPVEHAAYKIREGGEVLDKVVTTQKCFAVTLGGLDGKSLYCCTAPSSKSSEALTLLEGKIECATVDVPA